MGNFVKINKRTGWKKHTGGKIEPKYSLIIPILLVQVFEFYLRLNSLLKIINVLAGIRPYWWEKSSKINKRTGTFIRDSRVCIKADPKFFIFLRNC